ncbi:hypothetical protein [Shewanella fodinae]|jgi:hypothetical protein|uniref:Uncharacterized protein n=1 Tax=Shewanella fodinae TaxID=552357 RepID=A0A4R2F2I0_9GAMM|nr:hypothetical protein [Shewanella fodinae]TCN77723.1 hypothetical protein EDC91_14424 [Shewanella fodinae]
MVTKVYVDDDMADLIQTFIAGVGWDTFKSKDQMTSELHSEYGEVEIIPLTSELYAQMLASGVFEGYEP